MREGWEYKKLGEVCDFQGGSQPPKNEWSKEPKENYVRMLQIRDFTQDASNYIEYVKKTKSLKYCNEDDILLGRYGASVGKILSGLSGAYNVAIIKSIPKEIVRKRYLRLYFLSTYFQKNLIVVSQHRAAQAGFSKEDIFSFQIPIPPLSEQQRIVEELDLLSSIIEKKNAQLKELDSLAQSIFYDMFGNPILNDKGWEVKKIEEIGNVTTGNTPSRKKADFYNTEYIEWIKTDNILKDSIYATKAKEYLSEKGAKEGRIVEKNSLLVACIAGSLDSIGKVCVTNRKVAFNQQINAITPNQYFNVLFAYYTIKLMSSHIREHATSGMKHIITKSAMEKINLPLPPLPLQQQFAEKIEAIERQKEMIKQSIKEVETLFNSRMDYYFDG